MQKIKLIFLDIDGVMNSERYFLSYTEEERMEMRDEYGEGFDSFSKRLLNQLITYTNAKVVISSTWRHSGLAKMQSMWEKREMAGEVVGITKSIRLDDKSLPRGIEIQEYYERVHNFSHGKIDCKYMEERAAKCTLQSYVILDDDMDMLYEQKDNFVHCDYRKGFTGIEYIRALDILNT